MKKIIAILLCLLLAGSLAACSRIGETPHERISGFSSDTPGSLPESEPSDSSATTIPGADDPTSVGTTSAGAKSTKSTTKATGGDNVVSFDFDWDDIDTTAPGGKTTTTASTKKTTTTTTTAVPIVTQTTKASSKESTMILPTAGFSLDGKMQVKSATVSGNIVTLVFHNATKGYESDRDNSYCTYTCFDKDGKELVTDKLYPGRVNAGQDSEPVKIEVPQDTAEFRLTEFKIEYWTDGWR